MLKLIGIGIKADTSIARKIVDGIAIIGIGILIAVGTIATINHVKREGFPLIGNDTIAIECIGGPEDYGVIHINGNAIARNVEMVFKNQTILPLENLNLSCGVSLTGGNEIVIVIN